MVWDWINVNSFLELKVQSFSLSLCVCVFPARLNIFQISPRQRQTRKEEKKKKTKEKAHTRDVVRVKYNSCALRRRTFFLKLWILLIVTVAVQKVTHYCPRTMNLNLSVLNLIYINLFPVSWIISRERERECEGIGGDIGARHCWRTRCLVI